jgi:hypothetical protein
VTGISAVSQQEPHPFAHPSEREFAQIFANP